MGVAKMRRRSLLKVCHALNGVRWVVGTWKIVMEAYFILSYQRRIFPLLASRRSCILYNYFQLETHFQIK